jgi:hypothetical protein
MAVQLELHVGFSKGQKQSKDTRSTKLYYISSLRCVNELKQQLCESDTPLFLKCNLVNLMAFYAKLEYSTGGADDYSELQLASSRQITIQNNILAAQFIKSAVQLWQVQTSTAKVDLHLYLLKGGFLLSEDLKKLFVLPLVAAFKEIRILKQVAGSSTVKITRTLFEYLSEQMSVMCLCASSQPGFMQAILKETVALKELSQEL